MGGFRRSDKLHEIERLMEAGSAKSKPALGFLTVLDHPQHGLFGGYLLLNLAGRPLEFHCTAPIRPNRAQQILYGPTLEAFLYGEQIGATLIAQAKTQPLLVCTDREPVLAVRELVEIPVALVLVGEGSTGLATFAVGRNRLAVPQRADGDRQRIVESLAEMAESLDLAEPFTRIREAIEEAQQAAR
jgi:hypothetical protein